MQGFESHLSSTSHTAGYAVLTILPQKQETNNILLGNLDSVQLKSITNSNKTTNKLILITRRLITLTYRISALVAALESAVEAARNNTFVAPNVAHERIRTMYTWQNVARRTERVSLRSLLTHFLH